MNHTLRLMSPSTRSFAATLAVAALAVTTGIVRADASGSIAVDGSSTVGPISMKVAEEFEKDNPKVQATVGISGTGGGMKRFTKGETDVSDASRPIKKEEADIAKANGVEYVELPIAYDGITIVVNKNNDFLSQITVDELKKIFTEGGAKSWNEVNPAWPNKPIKIFSPGTDSGTFDYFKEVVAGSTGKIRADISVSEDDNVLVRGVEGDQGSIGFFGCAYYFANKDQLKSVPVVNPKTNQPVAVSVEAIKDASYAPFSRPLFVYVNKASINKPQVAAFVEFYLENAQDIAAEVGYVGLPTEIGRKAMANFKDKKVGSQFLGADGEHVEGALVDVYK